MMVAATVTVSSIRPVLADSISETGSQGSGYQHYVNSRFGFSIDVPKSFKANPSAEERNARSFFDRRNDSVVVWGNYNSTGETLLSAYREALRQHPYATYKAHGKNWYVIAYRETHGGVYEKYFINDQYKNGLIIRYPASRTKAMKPLCTSIAKSFKPGWTNPDREE